MLSSGFDNIGSVNGENIDQAHFRIDAASGCYMKFGLFLTIFHLWSILVIVPGII